MTRSYALMSGQWNVCNNADINECDTNNGGCSADANCTNNAGSFTCTCLSGYTGDGFTCTGSINIYLRHDNSKRHKIIAGIVHGRLCKHTCTHTDTLRHLLLLVIDNRIQMYMAKNYYIINIINSVYCLASLVAHCSFLIKSVN